MDTVYMQEVGWRISTFTVVGFTALAIINEFLVLTHNDNVELLMLTVAFITDALQDSSGRRKLQRLMHC